MAYEYKESHKHKLAKELLFKWLNDAEKQHGDYAKFAQFEWKKNWGIFMEMVVQEKDYPNYCENDYRCMIDENEVNNGIVPELGKILFVPDIVVFHKGHPTYIFEITHTHPLTPEKVQAMKDFFFAVKVIEIMADDILNLDCTKIPEKIKCTEW